MANQKKQEALESKNKADQQLENMQTICDGMLADAKEQASLEYEQIIADANKKSDEMIEQARTKTIEAANEEKAKAKSEIADLISRNTIDLVDEIPLVKKMAEQVTQMVVGSLDAFVKESDHLAHEVIEKDDTVDQYFGTIKEKLANYLGNHSANGDQAIDLLMIAKYLERIGDHAVNIAKWVHYAITGQLEG